MEDIRVTLFDQFLAQFKKTFQDSLSEHRKKMYLLDFAELVDEREPSSFDRTVYFRINGQSIMKFESKVISEQIKHESIDFK